MSFWSRLLSAGGKALGAAKTATKATARSAGSSVIHPTQTLRNAGSAVKAATVGGAVGYVGWEKLTTDKSVTRIVSDAVIGEEATDTIAETASDVKELKNKAGEAVDSVNNAMGDINSKWSGMSNFFRGIFSGNGMDMFGNFFSNLGKGKVSGLSLVGLVAAAYLVFGRFGWLGKIAGTMLGMMMIGNNANISQVLGGGGSGTSRNTTEAAEETQGRGRRR